MKYSPFQPVFDPVAEVRDWLSPLLPDSAERIVAEARAHQLQIWESRAAEEFDQLAKMNQDAPAAQSSLVHCLMTGVFKGDQLTHALKLAGQIRQPAQREIVVTKRFYGAFDGTDLEDVLFDFDVSDVILTGQGTKAGICHTAYGAFMAGYDISVPMDAVCATGEPEQQAALGDLKDMYGATLTTSTALIGRPVLRTAVSNPAK